MSNNNFTSLVSVLHVSDFDEAVEWYAKWLGRKPDITPDEGVAEWQLVENALIQVSVTDDPSLAVLCSRYRSAEDSLSKRWCYR